MRTNVYCGKRISQCCFEIECFVVHKCLSSLCGLATRQIGTPCRPKPAGSPGGSQLLADRAHSDDLVTLDLHQIDSRLQLAVDPTEGTLQTVELA